MALGITINERVVMRATVSSYNLLQIFQRHQHLLLPVTNVRILYFSSKILLNNQVYQ